MYKSAVLALLAIVAVPFSARGQQETAPPGYYPTCFSGDTFTGLLGGADDATRQITLTYTHSKGGKTETFVGAIEEEYMVSRQGGPKRQLHPSELPPGKPLTVFYCTEQKKIDGKKSTVHTILLIKDVTNYATHPSKYEGFR